MWAMNYQNCHFVHERANRTALAGQAAYRCAYVSSYKKTVRFNQLNFCFELVAVDCGQPVQPENGAIVLTNTTFGSVVKFSCSLGHYLQGNEFDRCEASKQWSSNSTKCIRKFPYVRVLVSMLQFSIQSVALRFSFNCQRDHRNSICYNCKLFVVL